MTTFARLVVVVGGPIIGAVTSPHDGKTLREQANAHAEQRQSIAAPAAWWFLVVDECVDLGHDGSPAATLEEEKRRDPLTSGHISEEGGGKVNVHWYNDGGYGSKDYYRTKSACDKDTEVARAEEAKADEESKAAARALDKFR